jgi:hypothetical protein
MGKRVNKKEIFIKSGIWIIKKLGEIKASIDIFINSEKQKSGKKYETKNKLMELTMKYP